MGISATIKTPDIYSSIVTHRFMYKDVRTSTTPSSNSIHSLVSDMLNDTVANCSAIIIENVESAYVNELTSNIALFINNKGETIRNIFIELLHGYDEGPPPPAMPASDWDNKRATEIKNLFITAYNTHVIQLVQDELSKIDDSKLKPGHQDTPKQDYTSNDKTNNDTTADGGPETDPIGAEDESGFYDDSELSRLQVQFKTRNPNYDMSAAKIDRLRHVFGMPYQFLPDTDRRMIGDEDPSNFSEINLMGRKYIERIAQRANILYITPGKPQFLQGASSDFKKTVLTSLLGLSTGELNSEEAKKFIDDKESVRYYSFEFDEEAYFEFLNPILRAAARYLNLHDKTIDNVPLDQYNYQNYIMAPDTAGYNAMGALTFYIDGMNSSQDNISNSTSESSFASTYDNSISSTAQEIWTLAGKGLNELTGSQFANGVIDGEGANATLDEMNNFISQYLGNNSFARNLTLGATAMVTGGHIIFPEIWRDADFRSDSIGVTIKLTVPDQDDESVFWGLLLPMYAVLTLASPRGYNNIDAYRDPFMIRAFCQSMFHVEMGYITGVSITKGAECCWTASGLPTSIEINLQIKDLYDSMYISSGTKDFRLSWDIFDDIKQVVAKTPFLKNTAMLNWIANSCGVNLNKPDILRDIDMYLMHVYVNQWNDAIPNWTLRLFDSFRNLSSNFFKAVGIM